MRKALIGPGSAVEVSTHRNRSTGDRFRRYNSLFLDLFLARAHAYGYQGARQNAEHSLARAAYLAQQFGYVRGLHQCQTMRDQLVSLVAG